MGGGGTPVAKMDSRVRGNDSTASLDLLHRITRALGGRLSVEFEGVRTRAA